MRGVCVFLGFSALCMSSYHLAVAARASLLSGVRCASRAGCWLRKEYNTTALSLSDCNRECVVFHSGQCESGSIIITGTVTNVLETLFIFKYRCAPLSTDSVSAVSVIRGSSRPEKKNWKLKKEAVHKFQNARRARTGRNMVKSSSTNAPSTWLIFLCPRTHASPQNVPPFCFERSRCSLELPRYRSVCVQKALVYQLNFTVFMFVTRISRYV
jgi:hypothetical protein